MIYKELNNTPNFTHDDATSALIKNGLVSSSGAIGEEAVKRSRRVDRSRDPLYNQLKMYSEIYRMLGWYVPGSKRTNFNIPGYGEYIRDAEGGLLKSHFELNTLHIVSPNPLVHIRSNNILRPFPMILKLFARLDGIIHRDEIILVVLSCENDRQDDYLERAAEVVMSIRGNYSRLEMAYENLMVKNGINSKDVYRNYTRFIMAALKWLDYATPKRIKGVYGNKSVTMYSQTDNGLMKGRELENIIDIRNDEIAHYSLEVRSAFTLYSFYYHFDKLGYDLSDPETNNIVRKVKEISKPILDTYSLNENRGFLYFGYQESTKEEKQYSESCFV